MEFQASRIELSADVAFREMSGESVLLDLASGTYFGLNEVGTRLWTLLSKDESLATATAALLQEFEVPRETLLADVHKIVMEMQSKGLLRIIRDNSPETSK